MAANPCDELQVDLSRVDVNVDISGPPCIDVDWVQADIVIESVTLANQGPKGDQGDPGQDGESIVGPSGPPGSPGTAASVDAGTTTTGVPGSAANVVNSGSSTTAVFDFTIPRGDVGATGPMGQGILIKGSVPNHASLPTTGNTPGDVWVTSDTSHGWAWNGTAWVDIGPIQGPPGAVGPSGPAGSDGAQGAAGAAATVAAGTTTTSAPGTNAAVINTGSSSTAVFAFTIPRGDVGAAGPAGAPGGAGSAGAPGAAGGNAWTLVTNASFTVPAYGANVTVQAGDTSWVALGEWVYVDDAGGPGVAGQLVVTSKTSTTLTLFNPTSTTYPLASTSVDGLLRQVSGKTTDFIDGTNNSQAIAPQIWNQRLRSYNAIGNPNFEVDQKNVGAPVANVNGTCIDRWNVSKGGSPTFVVSGVQSLANWTNPIVVPGTSFVISNNMLRVTLTTAQASLGTGDVLQITQKIEGPMFRELSFDVHSMSLLVRSSVAGLSFGLSLRDVTGTRSLSKLCTIPAANVFTLISLPNLPAWPTSGAFSPVPGVQAYNFGIVLAAGSAQLAPANDTWQNGNFLGAVGQSNFTNNAVNSTFDIAFVQHEPGPLCTTPMDKPFSQNLDECLRYYTKSYAYGTKAGSAPSGGLGQRTARVSPQFTTNTYDTVPFAKVMAKSPTIVIYAPDGTANAVQMAGGANVTVNNVTYLGDTSFSGFAMATAQTANYTTLFQYTADTGW